ncbi:DNA-binding response regulator [Paenibacillus selenitireducens]|uniref:DNA-binding response regulator n=1 Tax=Paenibacillus selenitireducens TaxID=1324314 RepID=A0A1T2X7E0_9BACL|nr:response regulator transcription factor [Paenibacillus selenitireducens]OPA75752.1 DNA-binding response regulator [Paenibacillus selenitireducens]
MAVIRVFLVEDDVDWRVGLSAYLAKQSDMEVVGTASNAEEAILLAPVLAPDVILMDIMLVGSMEGITLTAEISSRCQAQIIMLSSLTEKQVIFEAFKAGAVNYLVKSAFQDIPDAIRQAHASNSPIDARVADQIREEFRRLKQLEREYEVKQMKDLITPTEIQVLSMIDKGYTQTQIADKFVVSIRTVKNHVSHILKKLQGKSSKEAAQKAKDLGLFK